MNKVVVDGILQDETSNPYFRYFESYSDKWIEIRKYEYRKGELCLIGKWRYKVLN